MRRLGLVCLLVIVSLLLFTERTYAADVREEMSEEIEQFLDVLPEEMRETAEKNLRLTDGGGGAADAFRLSAFLARGAEILRDAWPGALTLLFRTVALLLVCSVFAGMHTAVGGAGVATAFTLASTLCLALTVGESLVRLLRGAEGCISALASLAAGITPLATAVCAASGCVSGASVTRAALMFVYTLLQNISTVLLLPVVRVSLALTLSGSVSVGMRLDALNRMMRRFFTWMLSLVVLLVSFVLGVQSAIAASADSFSLKTARFALGSFIPLVGGALSDALGTVTASLSLIKNTAGGIAMASVLVTVLPIALELLLSRAALALCQGMAEMLGRDGEGRLIGEMHGILGYVLALLLLGAVLFLFVLALLTSIRTGGSL